MAYSATIKSDLKKIDELDTTSTTVKDWVNKINEIIKNLNTLKQNLASDLDDIDTSIINEFTIIKEEHNTDIENIGKSISSEEQSIADIENSLNKKINDVDETLTTNLNDSLSKLEDSYNSLSLTLNTDLKTVTNKVDKIPEPSYIDDEYVYEYTELANKPLVLTDNFKIETSLDEDTNNIIDSYSYNNPDYSINGSISSVSQFYPDKIDSTDKDGNDISNKMVYNKFETKCGLMTFEDKIRLYDLVSKYVDNKLYKMEKATSEKIGGVKIDGDVFSLSETGKLQLNYVPSNINVTSNNFTNLKTIKLTGDVKGSVKTDFSASPINIVTSISSELNNSTIKNMEIEDNAGYIQYTNGFGIQWGNFYGLNGESVEYRKAFLYNPVCTLSLNGDVINDIAIDFGINVSYRTTLEKITIYNNLPDKSKKIQVSYVAFGKFAEETE